MEGPWGPVEAASTEDAESPGEFGRVLLQVNIITGEVRIDRLHELWPNWAEAPRRTNGGKVLELRRMEQEKPVVAVGAAHR